MEILVLCTGNTCRSQMAEGFLRSFDNGMKVYSAGTNPSDRIHPKAVEVMQEVGIDISKGHPKHVDDFIDENFDYVITACDEAREVCPVFAGDVKYHLHIGFEDPAEARGTEKAILAVFRNIRDEIQRDFESFYRNNIQDERY